MTEICHEGKDADERLKSLGLERADLSIALDRAAADARGCTELDAPSAAPSIFWTRANRYLREGLIPSNWTISNRDLVLRTVSPSGEFAVTATSASGAVGFPGGRLRTKNPKGSAMANIVRYNAHVYGGSHKQDSIEGLSYIEPPFESDALPVWFLLYRSSDGVLHSELSLPVEMHGKYVDTWSERILLEVMPLDAGEDFDVNIVDGPDDDGPDVFVERLK